MDCSDAAYQEILISIKQVNTWWVGRMLRIGGQIAAGRKMMKAIHQPAKRFDANGKELPREKKTLSAAEMKEARMVFDRFDSDGGGSLGIQEMLGALKQMGVYGYNAAGSLFWDVWSVDCLLFRRRGRVSSDRREQRWGGRLLRIR